MAHACVRAAEGESCTAYTACHGHGIHAAAGCPICTVCAGPKLCVDMLALWQPCTRYRWDWLHWNVFLTAISPMHTRRWGRPSTTGMPQSCVMPHAPTYPFQQS